ncbi:TlpA disulfide reductase family protein [Colwellia sp. UCD-KL20]|uniref:TlpA family protein disulfide reductase n=1 Tax=Colwellia sp. UCD-KL20 TaxID=1917165 RepID=UPI00097143F3|nr:TlpA disulfide reductase family protein [Colwellia sp. UCD-KL20]
MIRSLAIQVAIFVIIFNVISWFRATSMLPTETQLSPESSVLTTLMNEKIQLLSNDKETVIYFFAPWCQICHLSIENLEEFYLENENINVIAVALDYVDVKEVRDFANQHELTFPIALGNEAIKHQFSIGAYPSYYVIDKENKVVEKSLGYSSKLGMYLRTL